MTLFNEVALRGQVEMRSDPVSASHREPYGLDDLTGLSMTAGAISPAMARHMRKTMLFERQRPINQKNVERLAEAMRRGWFIAGTPVFICVLPDGREYIVNGNHTLEGVAESGVTIPLIMIRKRVPDMDAAARVYSNFDIQKMRSWTDTLRAVGYSETLPNAGLVGAALPLIMGDFVDTPEARHRASSRDLRLQMLPEYKRAAAIMAECMHDAPTASVRYLKRAPVFAVALYTAKHQPSFAAEFWRGMAMDDGLAGNDPRKALLRFCAKNSSSGTQKRMENLKAAVAAWNAGFEGRITEYFKPSAMSQIRILGTPFHKGKPQCL